MNEDEQQSDKRKTIRIKVPRKPAAPRHPQVMVKTIPLPGANAQGQSDAIHWILRLISFPLLQMVIFSVLAAMILDGGDCFQMVCNAVLAYFAGLTLMVLLRRENLTATDKFLIRWGFPILCVISFVISITFLSVRR